ncbi:response regulator transcription factor [Mucilaginibacter sp. JRF]|uniref:response regulator n=1 Tax=Mucilaginibacter sp. JRF TaxID=2780088 RepID=UPI001882C75F|nr:response regulator [Mucilaginibacter sp. JRF]MBE9585443.1 response regulator transcription factor [Mucilaginibacter sp. JRF]
MAAKILVIEDDKDILDVLEYVLEDAGYDVITAANGSVLVNINAIKPDVILIDEWLGAEKGSQHCKFLKSTTAMRHIPVVMMSAAMDIEHIADECGADAYIKKPFDIDHVTFITGSLLGNTVSNSCLPV